MSQKKTTTNLQRSYVYATVMKAAMFSQQHLRGGRVVFKATLIISGPDISISTPKNQSIYLSSRVKK